MATGDKSLTVQGVEIHLTTKGEEDYISLTDMVSKFEGGSSLIESWLRNKDTVEFLGVWERLNNPSFNSPGFEGIRNRAGLNRFTLSVRMAGPSETLLSSLADASAASIGPSPSASHLGLYFRPYSWHSFSAFARSIVATFSGLLNHAVTVGPLTPHNRAISADKPHLRGKGKASAIRS